MGTGLIPQRSPDLLCRHVGEDHAYAVNCSYPNSFRVLNKTQYRILEAVNGQDDINTIAQKEDIQANLVEQFMLLLSKTQIVRFDSLFSFVQKPAKPQNLNFWIHTTNACNLGCSYCYISTLNTGKGMSSAVKQQLIYKLVDTAENQKIKTIKLRLAGGEPLSQFNSWKALIPEAFTALADVGCRLEIAFITNLTMLTDEIIEFSRQYNISFGVSIDGLRETHDVTRQFRSGAGTFETVDSNLKLLLANGIAVSINTVLNNFNLVGLPDLTRYLIALNVPFRYSIVKGEAVHSALLDEYLTASYSVMQEAIEEGWQFSGHFQFCDLKPNDLGFQTCASGFSGGAIYIDGSFKYCHVHFGKETKSTDSIFDEGLDLVQMIEGGEHHEESKSEDCKKCRYRSICTSGCPVYRVNDKDPQCSIYHRFIPKYFELQAKERLYSLRKCEILRT